MQLLVRRWNATHERDAETCETNINSRGLWFVAMGKRLGRSIMDNL